MSKQYIVHVFGKEGCAKCTMLNRRLDTLLASDKYKDKFVKQYDSGRLPLYHMDVYRIGDVDEMEEVGAQEMFASGGVCLIEWGGMIEDILPEDTVWIRIERDREDDFNHRRITCSY